jgi:pyrroloquinoline quinone biosynthesis protein B
LAGCILTDAEIDHTSGLLQLREGCRLGIFSTAIIRRWLNRYFPVEPILNSFAERPWTELPLDTVFDLPLPSGVASGLRVQAFELGRDVPRYVPEDAADAVGSVIGLEVQDRVSGGTLVYAPGVPDLNAALRSAAAEADCLLVDGTFWSEEELQRLGISAATAHEMGHVPISGRDGTLAWLSGLTAKHRVYIHINNTNPVLHEDGPEQREVAAAGVFIGADGDTFEI